MATKRPRSNPKKDDIGFEDNQSKSLKSENKKKDETRYIIIFKYEHFFIGEFDVFVYAQHPRI